MEEDYSQILTLLTTLKKNMDERFDAVDKRFDEIDDRFDGVANRFDGVDDRFDGVDDRFDGVDDRFDGVDDRFDGIEKRLDNAEKYAQINSDRIDIVMQSLERINYKIDNLTDIQNSTLLYHGKKINGLELRMTKVETMVKLK